MSFWVKRAAAALAALALLAGQAASAQVPDPFARDLARQLAQAEQVLNAQNFYRGAGPFSGPLAQRQTRSVTISLRAGQEYRMVGVCEQRCADLNLRLIDPNGQQIAADVLPDRVPILQVRPTLTGQHTIEIDMIRCRAPQCWYAMNIYSR